MTRIEFADRLNINLSSLKNLLQRKLIKTPELIKTSTGHRLDFTEEDLRAGLKIINDRKNKPPRGYLSRKRDPDKTILDVINRAFASKPRL